MSELRERIVAAWNELDQRIIDMQSVSGALVSVLASKLWMDISNTNCDLLYQISCAYIIVKYRDITRTLYLTVSWWGPVFWITVYINLFIEKKFKQTLFTLFYCFFFYFSFYFCLWLTKIFVVIKVFLYSGIRNVSCMNYCLASFATYDSVHKGLVLKRDRGSPNDHLVLFSFEQNAPRGCSSI